MAEPSGSPPGPAHASRRIHPSAAIESSRLLLARRYLQRGRSILSTLRGCCDYTTRFLSLVTVTFDLWPWHSNSSERRTKHVFRVNLAQIRSAGPVMRCRMRVSRIERASMISRIWRINGRQTITVNSEVSVPKLWTRVNPRKQVLHAGAYWRHMANTIEQSTFGRRAETVEPTAMPFRVWTWLGPRNHVLDGVQVAPCQGATFRGKGHVRACPMTLLPWAVQQWLNGSRFLWTRVGPRKHRRSRRLGGYIRCAYIRLCHSNI